MTRLSPALAALTLALAACGGTPDLYPVTPPPVAAQIPLGFAAVEVRNISLPTYAAASEIAVEDETGRLVTRSGVLWADSPERAIALELAGHLARMSRSRVATEPWPFEAFPDAKAIDVTSSTDPGAFNLKAGGSDSFLLRIEFNDLTNLTTVEFAPFNAFFQGDPDSYQFGSVSVPVPGTLALLGAGLLLMGWARRRI